MGNQQVIESVNVNFSRTDVPRMDVGDTVSVHCRIIEGQKERIQVFQGVLIGRAGRGVSEMITVRRVVEDHGVERIFPLLSPKVAQIDVVRRGDARRAKLYYLRDRAGKSRRLRDRRRGMKHVAGLPIGEMPSPVPASSGESKGDAKKK
ncbi:MAG: 50S ribosomal protein L19 [Phycisphaerae bacterium]|nr:50S ribosomal protein L19 [Phycisphaerae bacterium]